ncbi:MAG: putative DNA-binding domain-containing protein [Betaproteobacteria bacterium]|nr:putative DNA-binding domain-containing protein [Betaproteobacteria bacterium]
MTHPERLGRLQAQFVDAVLEGDREALAPHLAGEAGLATRRLAIYRGAISANRRDALRAAYPVVARLVGDAFFDEAARRHSQTTPPDRADLNRHGASFPAFLAAYAHAQPMPWLADVARLEWAWQESLMAADAPRLDFAALALVREDEQADIRFRLHPGVRLVRSAWPVYSIWEANQPDRDGTPDREEGADDVLVWREEQRVRQATLDLPEAAFVEGLARGLALGEVAGRQDGWDCTAILHRLAEHGMLCGFSTGDPPGP